MAVFVCWKNKRTRTRCTPCDGDGFPFCIMYNIHGKGGLPRWASRLDTRGGLRGGELWAWSFQASTGLAFVSWRVFAVVSTRFWHFLGAKKTGRNRGGGG